MAKYLPAGRCSIQPSSDIYEALWHLAQKALTLAALNGCCHDDDDDDDDDGDDGDDDDDTQPLDTFGTQNFTQKMP